MKREEYTKLLRRREKNILQNNKEPSTIINTDILILCDSKTKYLKEEILDNTKTRQGRYFALRTMI